jgi:hypothetical protein
VVDGPTSATFANTGEKLISIAPTATCTVGSQVLALVLPANGVFKLKDSLALIAVAWYSKVRLAARSLDLRQYFSDGARWGIHPNTLAIADSFWH